MAHFSELFSFSPAFSLLLSLGSECVGVHMCMCVSSDCLPSTNWSVFLSAGWQVPVCLTIDRQPPYLTHTQHHTYHRARWACVPPSPDKLSLGSQINIQAKHWLYIIELWCHECTTGATLDAATMCTCTHADTHQHQHLAASCARYPVCWLGAGHEYRITILFAPHSVLWWILPLNLNSTAEKLSQYLWTYNFLNIFVSFCGLPKHAMLVLLIRARMILS